jgi:transposase
VVGLDVHKESVVVGVMPSWSERVTETTRMENTSDNIERLVKRVTAKEPVEFVYEAGPCGYEIQRQITKLGQVCVVIAPGLIPQRPCDRVKTDRRDAEKLARLWRAGELTAIHIPTEEEEAARDLVRVREDALQDRLRHRHRLGKFLLRQGRVYRETKTWGVTHVAWLKAQKFESPILQRTFEAYVRAREEVDARLEVLDQQVHDLAGEVAYKTPVAYLRCLKGIDALSAITILVEARGLRRFDAAPAFMKFTGMTSSEYSSAENVRRGSITKTGNAHLRRVLVEAAWCYRRMNTTGLPLLNRRKECPPQVVQLAKKAQDRLHRKFHRMVGRNKPLPKVATAVARELAGFVWSMSQHFPASIV